MSNDNPLTDAQLPERGAQQSLDEVVAHIPEKVDEFEGLSTNWRELWALSQITNSCSRSVWWDYVGPAVWLAVMTKMLWGLEASWLIHVILWIGTGWMIDESIRNRALRSIITRLKKKANQSP